MRITITEFYNAQSRHNDGVLRALSDIQTSVAVLVKGNTPLESDVKILKKDVSDLQKRVWQIPSIASIIAIAGLVVSIMAMNSK